MHDNSAVIAALEDLIATCRRSRDNFRLASKNVSSREFRRLFGVFYQQRVRFLMELEMELHRIRGGLDLQAKDAAPRPASNPGTTKHAAPSFDLDETSVVDECHRCEEAAVSRYREMLRNDLPVDIRYVVRRQYMDIKDACERLRVMQRAA